MNHTSHKPTAGFTFIELVIVILILGILAGVGAPKYIEAVQITRAQAAARHLAADFSRARQQAKLQSKSQVVVLSLEHNSYLLTGMSHPDHPGQAYSVDLSAPPFDAALVGASFAAVNGKHRVTFNQHGRPNKSASIVVAAGDSQQTVVIDGVSGEVSIQP